MSAWDLFKAGCELCAGFAQSFWDSLNVWEQIVAVVAGVIGASLVLGCTGGFIAGLIGRRIRARREKAALPGPWLRDRLAGVLTAEEKRALLDWAEKHPYGEELPEESEEEA